MPSEDKDKMARPDAPQGPPRPTPTIELEAQEVTDREPPGEAQGEPAPQDEPPPDAASPPPDDGQAEEQTSAAAEADSAGPAAPPPARTRRRELAAFFTHLAAGLAGGLIGVVAAVYGLDRLPLPVAGEGAPGQQAEELARGLGALQSRLDRVETMARQAPDAMARVARLEETLQGLGEAAEKGSGGVAEAAALAARINSLAERLDAEVAGLRQALGEAATGEAVRAELKRLEEVVAGLRQEVAAGGDAAAREQALAARLEELGKRMAALEADAERTGQSAAGERARAGALVLAFANLRRAVVAGQPYGAELQAVEALAGDADADLAALKAHAAQGVATAARLAARFEAAARAAREAEAPGGDTMIDRLLGAARSVVTVRRVAPGDGATTADILARMEARLAEGDLAVAVAEAERLAPAPREALQPWLDQARARLEAERRLAAVEARLVAALGRTAEAPGR